MSFWAWWVLVWLTVGIVSFLILGLYFVRKEMQWGALERKRETWALLMSIVEFVERDRDISPKEFECKTKDILKYLELDVSSETLELILQHKKNFNAC